MGPMRRAVFSAGIVLAVAAPAASADLYAGFGDPVPLRGAAVSGDVIDAAPLPDGRALVLVLGGQSLQALDTGDLTHPQNLGHAWDAAVVTWPGGRSLVASVGPDGLHIADRVVDPPAGTIVKAVARPDGSAIVAWSSGTPGPQPSTLRAVVVAADGTPGAVADLGAVSAFALAGGTNGTTALAWSLPAGGPLQAAVLTPGTSAWSALRAVAGPLSGPVPPLAVAPDGTVAISTGGSVERFRADGTQLPDLPAPSAMSGLGVASDGTTVFAAAGGGGWSLGGVRADGSLLPAASTTRDDVTYGTTTVHAWPDGAATLLQTAVVGDASAPYSSFAVRDPAGRSDGTALALGPGLAGFPGTAPGSFTGYAVQDRGTLVRITRPGAPARRPAKLTLIAGQLRPSQRIASFHLAADQAGTATISTRVRRGTHGAWHNVTPGGSARHTLLPLTSSWLQLPLPGKGSVCRANLPWAVDIHVSFINRAGVRARGALRFASTCQRRRQVTR